MTSLAERPAPSYVKNRISVFLVVIQKRLQFDPALKQQRGRGVQLSQQLTF
jgi:hypothetical protein